MEGSRKAAVSPRIEPMVSLRRLVKGVAGHPEIRLRRQNEPMSQRVFPRVSRVLRSAYARLPRLFPAAAWILALVTAIGFSHGRQAGVVNMIFLGDTGTGDARQREVGSQMAEIARREPLDYVVLLGDNIYGGNKGNSFGEKFLKVYDSLFTLGVHFHAALGNHDVEDCRVAGTDPLPAGDGAYIDTADCWAREQLQVGRFGYEGGRRYYSFASPEDPPLVETFVLDSNTLRGGGDEDDEEGALGATTDAAQLEWLRQALGASRATWKILAMHHPVHSPKGRRLFGLGHKPETDLRAVLEPVIVDRVDVVFQGHNHLYARMLPLHGVRYFVSGGGGQKPYRFNPDEDTVARPGDRGRFNHFVYTRITRDRFQYCVIDKEGTPRDGGWFRKGDAEDTPFPPGGCPPLETGAADTDESPS